MLHALIVDDEAPARSELRFLLEETGRVESIEEVASARDAVQHLVHIKEHDDERCDVLFLDISMPKTSGMQLAEALHKLKNPPAVVFVTAYSEYALEAFEVDAVDYLMKPVETDRLARALDKVEARVKPTTTSHSSVERIPVEKGGRKVLVPVDQIRYIEAKDDYSCIYTDVDRYLSTISLAKLEQKLSTATSPPSRWPSSSRSSRSTASSACTVAISSTLSMLRTSRSSPAAFCSLA